LCPSCTTPVFRKKRKRKRKRKERDKAPHLMVITIDRVLAE
jgi:hypothetical protein